MEAGVAMSDPRAIARERGAVLKRAFELPRRRRGRQTSENEAEYQTRRGAFCRLIRQIRSTMDFDVGSRGWCYILEPHGLTKGDFDAAQVLITDCRKTGELPLDICAEDDSRETIGLQGRPDNADVENKAQGWVDFVRNDAHRNYRPFNFWDISTSMSKSRSKSSTCAICSSPSARISSSRSRILRAGRT
jgi:hypothetical protein